MKCVLDRLILAAGCGENRLHHKVGAALCTLRRSGGMETYQQLLGTINTMEMVLVTSDYWNAVHGAEKGEVIRTRCRGSSKLSRNIAWMLKVIDKAGIRPPRAGHRTMTNFIHLTRIPGLCPLDTLRFNRRIPPRPLHGRGGPFFRARASGIKSPASWTFMKFDAALCRAPVYLFRLCPKASGRKEGRSARRRRAFPLCASRTY